MGHACRHTRRMRTSSGCALTFEIVRSSLRRAWPPVATFSSPENTSPLFLHAFSCVNCGTAAPFAPFRKPSVMAEPAAPKQITVTVDGVEETYTVSHGLTTAGAPSRCLHGPAWLNASFQRVQRVGKNGLWTADCTTSAVMWCRHRRCSSSSVWREF